MRLGKPSRPRRNNLDNNRADDIDSHSMDGDGFRFFAKELGSKGGNA